MELCGEPWKNLKKTFVFKKDSTIVSVEYDFRIYFRNV